MKLPPVLSDQQKTSIKGIVEETKAATKPI